MLRPNHYLTSFRILLFFWAGFCRAILGSIGNMVMILVKRFLTMRIWNPTREESYLNAKLWHF
ncbi:hypothetical protein I7I50_02475 [Histoplasma capsulatum G186AR]|uniref:Uncharacterized protein n=1 Tax=Ajellomyces capsulatus TaxID=5037 RepID=A0A8H8D624_AJECA|nr:hypothetical protein I7I52_00861 [Histoplasma capsulatum]QSS71584.1 hypothetical protein I7I50_02475 [Histoplasma capsulatum G186AR]